MKYRWYVLLGLVSIVSLVAIQLITGEAWIWSKTDYVRKVVLKAEDPAGFYLVNAVEFLGVVGIWLIMYRAERKRGKSFQTPAGQKR